MTTHQERLEEAAESELWETLAPNPPASHCPPYRRREPGDPHHWLDGDGQPIQDSDAQWFPNGVRPQMSWRAAGFVFGICAGLGTTAIALMRYVFGAP